MNKRYLPYIIFLIFSIAVVALLLLPDKKITTKTKFANEKKTLANLAEQLDTALWENTEEKLLLAERGILLSKEIKDNNHLALFLYLKSNLLFQLEKFDSLEYYAQSAIALSDSIGNKLLKARTQNVIASYYVLHAGNYHEAFLHFLDVLKLSEQVGSTKGMASASNNIGLIYRRLNEPKKALKYFQNALDYFQKEGDQRNAALVNTNIGTCYIDLLQYENAIKYHNDALYFFRDINDSLRLAGEFVNLGIIYRKLKQYHKALDYLQQARDYSQFHNFSLLSESLMSLGIVYLELNNLELAKANLNESLKLLRNAGRKLNEAEVLYHLSIIAEKEGDIPLAYKYYKASVDIQESTKGAEIQKKIVETQAMYNLQKQEYETEIIQNKYQLKVKQNTILTLILFSSLIIIVLFALVLRLKNRDIKKTAKLAEMEKKQHQAEMEARNKELVTASLQLAVKNDILQDIANVSEKINARSQTGVMELKRSLNTILKQNYNFDNDWNNFKNMFEQVHIDFFDNIKNLDLNLSESELRVCAFIKINLQNKEIAKIMHINPESVLKSRYRIRKKLNLDKEESLDDFIRNM